MKLSEKLESVVCNGLGEVCIAGSDSDKEIIKEVIQKLIAIEEILEEE